MMTGSGIQTDKRDVFSWAVRYMAQKNYVLVKNELKANSADQFAADPNLLWGAVRSYKHGEQADAFLDGLRQKSRVVDLPARKWLISLETGSKSQTTKRVW
ncbi:MAG: hypothetical protein IPH37_11975 [Burkholderiales bacterium]|nr:hypothetical protein [Burkholderiales bacterium]